MGLTSLPFAHGGFRVNTAFHLPRLVEKLIEAFIYPDHTFGTEIIFIHGDIEEPRGFSLVQKTEISGRRCDSQSRKMGEGVVGTEVARFLEVTT